MIPKTPPARQKQTMPPASNSSFKKPAPKRASTILMSFTSTSWIKPATFLSLQWSCSTPPRSNIVSPTVRCPSPKSSASPPNLPIPAAYLAIRHRSRRRQTWQHPPIRVRHRKTLQLRPCPPPFQTPTRQNPTHWHAELPLPRSRCPKTRRLSNRHVFPRRYSL